MKLQKGVMCLPHTRHSSGNVHLTEQMSLVHVRRQAERSVIKKSGNKPDKRRPKKMIRGRDSSVGRPPDRKTERYSDDGSIPRSYKTVFSQSQLSVQSVAVFEQPPCAIVCINISTCKHAENPKHSCHMTQENTAHIGRSG